APARPGGLPPAPAVRDPARIAFAVVAGVAGAVVTDAFVHGLRRVGGDDRRRWRGLGRGFRHRGGDGFGARGRVGGLDHAPRLLLLAARARRVLHGQAAAGIGAAVDGDVAVLRDRATGARGQ